MKLHHLFLPVLLFAAVQNIVSFDLKTFPPRSVLVVNGVVIKPVSVIRGMQHYNLPDGWTFVLLRAPSYRDKYIPFHKQHGHAEEYKLERMQTHLIFDACIKTGSQPKSVRFSPDGKYYVTALLNGKGIEVFYSGSGRKYAKVSLPEKYEEKKGFVETLFIPRVHELWVSQMTTGMIHAFDSRNFSYLFSFPSGGRWPKVIAADMKGKRAFVSNWESRTVSVIDIRSRQILEIIHTPGIPRGLGISPDGKYLYAALYSSGMVIKIDLSSFKIIKKILLGHGAPRHLTVARKADKLYVSDMYRGTISEISISTDRILKTLYVGSNLNTIALSPDERYLFISSRGKNSKEGYLHKGPVFGKIFVYDTEKRQLVDGTWGGNQPTGLAVSPDGKTVAFSDFLDEKIEIYRWEM